MYNNVATRVLTGEVRLSYVNLVAPRANNNDPNGVPKYSVTLLMGYCKKWLRACVAWNNCNLSSYGAPCPGCVYSSPLENPECKDCEHSAWKAAHYVQ